MSPDDAGDDAKRQNDDNGGVADEHQAADVGDVLFVHSELDCDLTPERRRLHRQRLRSHRPQDRNQRSRKRVWERSEQSVRER
jgi:hypothetical protein